VMSAAPRPAIAPAQGTPAIKPPRACEDRKHPGTSSARAHDGLQGGRPCPPRRGQQTPRPVVSQTGKAARAAPEAPPRPAKQTLLRRGRWPVASRCSARGAPAVRSAPLPQHATARPRRRMSKGQGVASAWHEATAGEEYPCIYALAGFKPFERGGFLFFFCFFFGGGGGGGGQRGFSLAARSWPESHVPDLPMARRRVMMTAARPRASSVMTTRPEDSSGPAAS